MPSLEALGEAGHTIPLVVTQPDRPGHRLRLTPPAVKVAAEALGLEVSQPQRIRAPEAVERVARGHPELVVVVAYGQIIPAPLLALPPRGTLNVHASLLPRHRGAAPIAHAILAGDPMTGVTIMLMDELLDHGPILSSRETEVGAEEDAANLGARLARLGAGLLVETIDGLEGLIPREQDHDSATVAPRLSREDGNLDWDLDADAIDRHVRAFQPWPGVTLPWGSQRLKVLRGRPAAAAGGRPGQEMERDAGGVLVETGSGAYRLIEVQLPGGRPMAAASLPRPGL